MIRVLTAGLFAAACGASVAFAQDDDYFQRFEGNWTGGGSVQVRQLPEPLNVNCEMDGTLEGADAFSLAGNCTALLVMNRDIAAEISRDPATDRYTGVYTGSESGPAQLDGTRNGDTLELDVTWGEVIYDDDQAQMRITNAAGEGFRMEVIELIDGEEVVVSDLTFERG